MKVSIVKNRLCLLLLVAGTSSIQADEALQGGPSMSLKQFTLSSGGGKMASSSYEVVTVIGQIDAGHEPTGAGVAFSGGLLRRNRDLIFRDEFD